MKTCCHWWGFSSVQRDDGKIPIILITVCDTHKWYHDPGPWHSVPETWIGVKPQRYTFQDYVLGRWWVLLQTITSVQRWLWSSLSWNPFHNVYIITLKRVSLQLGRCHVSCRDLLRCKIDHDQGLTWVIFILFCFYRFMLFRLCTRQFGLIYFSFFNNLSTSL